MGTSFTQFCISGKIADEVVQGAEPSISDLLPPMLPDEPPAAEPDESPPINGG